VQLETDQEASRLSQLIGRMQHTEKQFDQESGTSQTTSIAEKVKVITQSKILNVEAQQAVNTWCDFIQQTKNSAPSIIQTTFKVNTESEKNREIDEASSGTPGTTTQSEIEPKSVDHINILSLLLTYFSFFLHLYFFIYCNFVIKI
jgi:hypothetical protein